MDLSRIPDWGWTVVLGILSMVAFGLMFVLGPSALGGTFQFPGTVIAIGLLGGLLARRAADLLGMVAGIVLVFEVLAVVEIAGHGAPLETLRFMAGTALIPGGFAAIVGLIVLGVRRGLRRAGVRSGLLRAAGVAVVFVGIA